LADTVSEYRIPVRHIHLKRADYLCHGQTPEIKPDGSGLDPVMTNEGTVLERRRHVTRSITGQKSKIPPTPITSSDQAILVTPPDCHKNLISGSQNIKKITPIS
jgi:hypothetical protein